jgi:hypothetical protein
MPGRGPSITRRGFLTASLATLAVSACEGSSVSAPPPTPVGGYTTTFAGTENPLSEGGAWSHRGWSWTKVQKKDGLAYGTQTGFGGYDDSYAYLSGFAPDHQGEAVVHVSPALNGAPHEAEILLRWADSALSARGYECLWSFEGDIQIMRWNGPFGDFTEIGGDDDGLGRSLVTGDVLRARMVGPVITCYVNDVLLAQATDATWKDGQPGIGFFRRESGASSDLAFSRYTATSLS